MGIIYHIFCTVTGKAYVGQTWSSLERRWSGHRKPTSGCLHLSNAIKKYGPGSFVQSVLTKGLTTQEQMDSAERYWMGYFDCIENGYNIREAGSRGPISEVTKAKISLANRGHRMSDVQKHTMSLIHLGKPLSDEHKKKIGDAGRGRVFTGEHKRKIGKANAGKRRSEQVCIDIARRQGCLPFVDQHGVRYETLHGAGRLLGISFSDIWKVLKGKRKSAGGYIFHYIEGTDG